MLLAFLGAAPFTKVDGNQFLLFDLLHRKFVLFGMVFWPSDFYLVALLFLTGIVSLVLFTATLGRIWCGWLCPQTIFLEMVFRKIEWLIEGGPSAQARRNNGPWTFDRLWRFSAKHSIFLGVSFLIANVFLAYFISGDTLTSDVTDGPVRHLELFISLVTFTMVFYFVFARFREQACLIACPYGRYMSALVDENTVTVTYDFKRGENRSKWSRNDARATRSSGHCIDCHQCVTVCPTGIDIRNGIQLECVACTACIDACDDVMEKVGLPTGLIRYASAKGVESGQTTWLTTRIKGYLSIWSVLMIIVLSLFIFRSTLDVSVLRSPGMTWTTTTHGVANFYDLQIINKTSRDLPISLHVTAPVEASVTPLGLPAVVHPGEILKGRFLVTLPNAIGTHSETNESHEESHRPLELDLVSNGETLRHLTTTFLTPE
jgi:cytochrome c oxidase accessory protein FixG